MTEFLALGLCLGLAMAILWAELASDNEYPPK